MLLTLVCLVGAELTLAMLTAGRFYTIPCKAHSVQGVKYRKISWYKVIGSDYQGLVMKNLLDNQTTLYRGANHSYTMGEGHSLLLPASALSDCGTYQCTLWPPLGHYIQEGQYEYYPAGCVRPTKGSPIIPFTAAQTSWRNLAAWGIPAAFVIFIVTLGSVFSLCHRPKKYKLADIM